MGNELTGILAGTGAKMKGEVLEDHVVFRGAVKAEVPFEDIVAEARGTLLILSFHGHTVELGAGARASQLASKVRSPPSRLDRLGVAYGQTAAVAGPIDSFDATFRRELGTRTDVAAGPPKGAVDVLFFAVAAPAQLEPLPKLATLVRPDGSLWIVAARGTVPAAQVASAAKASGLKVGATARFSASHEATRLTR